MSRVKVNGISLAVLSLMTQEEAEVLLGRNPKVRTALRSFLKAPSWH